jgi:hypothetical protein
MQYSSTKNLTCRRTLGQIFCFLWLVNKGYKFESRKGWSLVGRKSWVHDTSEEPTRGYSSTGFFRQTIPVQVKHTCHNIIPITEWALCSDFEPVVFRLIYIEGDGAVNSHQVCKTAGVPRHDPPFLLHSMNKEDMVFTSPQKKKDTMD